MSTTPKPRRVHIKTWGCQMNVYDTVRMADVLAPLGFTVTDTVDDADMVILNTCHIREKATEKVFSDLGRLRAENQRRQSRGNDRMIVAVAGCVAQAEGEALVQRAPFVDMVFGPQTYHQLPEMVAQVLDRRGERILNTDFPVESKFDHLPEESAGQGVSAFLSVQEGCDKFCTFCVVPYTRGAEFSRPVAQVLAEARRLVASGAREITLLGQNVNAYHGDGPGGHPVGLGGLIRRLAEIDGLWRIRYTTSHPKDMDEDLIAAHGEVPQLMPYLHLPVQSGSDRILAAMNRKHSRDDYRRVVERLRLGRPDLALSSDFIVGFPGETDRDFAETLGLVADIGYAQAYSFKYSQRPGTPAAAEAAQVPEAVKADRLQALQNLLNAQQLAFNRSCVGRILSILLDRTGKKPGQFLGRTPYLQAAHFDGGALTWGRGERGARPRLGRLVQARVTAAFENSLAATPIAAHLVAGEARLSAADPIAAPMAAESSERRLG